MKSAKYRVSGHPEGKNYYLVVYDETFPCWCCELPVNEASVSCTTTCGTCDRGRDRSPKCRKNKWKSTGPKLTVEDFWRNVTQRFYFATQEECDQKMYELHQQGVIGWDRVIEKITQRQAADS